MEPKFIPDDANAALSCIAYDYYDNGMLGGQRDLHTDGCIPLAWYKLITHMVIPKYLLEDDSFLLFPGEFDPVVDFELASDESKKIAQTLLKAHRRNELLGVCLSDFDERNVVVNPYGRAKIKGVTILKGLSIAQLHAQLDRNYQSTVLIIRGLYSGATIPDDIAHLLDLIESHFEDREIFHIHASLVPMTKVSAVFKELYDHLFFVLPKHQMRIILGELHQELSGYLSTWKQKILGNFLLKYTFLHNKNGYEVPANRAYLNKKTQQLKLQKQLWKDQINALKSVGIVPPVNQRTLSQQEEDWIEVALFLEYRRNRTSHRMEPMEKFMVAQQGRNYKYKGEGSERVCHARFSKVLCFLQYKIFRFDRLADIPSESYM